MDKVSQIEVLESIVVNGLALSPTMDLSEKRIREEAISPAKLVTVDVEGDGGNDCLTREAGGTRWFGSLTTPRTRSGSTGRSLVMRRGNGGGLAIDSAKDVIDGLRSIVKRHDDSVVVVGVSGSG